MGRLRVAVDIGGTLTDIDRPPVVRCT
ncbi:MAG: hypothetical protein ACI8PT_004944, partial [Gammaproteobacteria bacterium]